MSESGDEAELQNIIARGWKSFLPEIDITNFIRKTHWGRERIRDGVQNALYGHPEIFYVPRTFKIGWWQYADGTLVKIALTGFQYDFKAAEYWARKRRFDEAVFEAMTCVHGVTDDVEKAMRLHDHLVRICDYDVAAAKANDCSCQARTSYSALVRGKAVCEGYAMAYRHLLNVAGIASDVAVSSADCHVWNYVRIRGRWYHVDVTYDDPVCDSGILPSSKISHRHFLMSDKKARETGHRAWTVHGLPPASDVRYDMIR